MSSTAQAIRPASRKTAADHAPVASRSTPLTAGASSAGVSPMRWCSDAIVDLAQTPPPEFDDDEPAEDDPGPDAPPGERD